MAYADYIMPDAKYSDCDRLMAEFKTLSGFMPDWSQRCGGKGREWQVRWPVLDQLSIGVGFVAIECDAPQTHYSFRLILLQKPVHGLDVVPEDERKDNPLSARKILPPLPETIRGSHMHSWQHNRDWCMLNGLGDLPIRSPLEARPTSFAHALVMFADQTNIFLEAGQRQVALPPQAGLFGKNSGGR